jgi:Bacterial SH3 domain
MKARILDSNVKMYNSMDLNAISIATLSEGSEVDFGGSRRKGGKLWVPITLPTGQQGFIPGETRIYVIQQGSLLQNNVDLRSEPKEGSPVKKQLTRNEKLEILQVVKGEEMDWVRVRDTGGNDGYIAGNTHIHVVQQRTKAMATRNIFSGAMWLVAGLAITFSRSSTTSGGGFQLVAYGAILFGVVMLIMGVMQYFRAKI